MIDDFFFGEKELSLLTSYPRIIFFLFLLIDVFFCIISFSISLDKCNYSSLLPNKDALWKIYYVVEFGGRFLITQVNERGDHSCMTFPLNDRHSLVYILLSYISLFGN